MSIEYILLDINYDEGETTKTEFEDFRGLELHFDGDVTLFEELVKEGVFEWEWGVFHLVNLGDYK